MIKNFTRIPLELPHRAILRRMGHNRHLTVVTPEQEKRLDGAIQDAFALCRPSGWYEILTISACNGQTVCAGCERGPGVRFESVSLCRLLEGCARLVLLAGTVGREVSEVAGAQIVAGQGVEALVSDATASETADAVLDWLSAYLQRELPRTGGRLTAQRFSPGYGDLSLEGQEQIFTQLALAERGLELTASRMLLPEKSVLAIAGIL